MTKIDGAGQNPELVALVERIRALRQLPGYKAIEAAFWDAISRPPICEIIKLECRAILAFNEAPVDYFLIDKAILQSYDPGKRMMLLMQSRDVYALQYFLEEAKLECEKYESILSREGQGFYDGPGREA